jgi:predicted transposase YdaD
MHEYDTVLKALLQSQQSTIFERITGVRIEQWLNVEFPEVQQTRVDVLGATAGRERIAGLELQSSNDMKLPLRMAEYALRTYRTYEMFPAQYVLYVGNAELRMPSELVGLNFSCRYKIIDIRELDEESLLSSPFDGDNIMAILTRHRDRRETIRRILERIATLEGERRDQAFKKLMILAGLRKLADSVRTEVKHMPILDDIMDHDVIGPAIREGIQKGLKEGRQEGRQEGEAAILRLLLAKRYGALPAWVDQRLTDLSITQLEELSLRVFDAKSLEELFSS